MTTAWMPWLQDGDRWGLFLKE